MILAVVASPQRVAIADRTPAKHDTAGIEVCIQFWCEVRQTVSNSRDGRAPTFRTSLSCEFRKELRSPLHMARSFISSL
jgi:hypothetical protein